MTKVCAGERRSLEHNTEWLSTYLPEQWELFKIMCHVARRGHKVRTAQKIRHSTAGTERSAAAFAAVKQRLCLNSELQTIYDQWIFCPEWSFWCCTVWNRYQTPNWNTNCNVYIDEKEVVWSMAGCLNAQMYFPLIFLFIDSRSVSGCWNRWCFILQDWVLKATDPGTGLDSVSSAGGGACRKTRADKARRQNYWAEFASWPSVASHFLNLI